jgi:hypothetical protein
MSYLFVGGICHKKKLYKNYCWEKCFRGADYQPPTVKFISTRSKKDFSFLLFSHQNDVDVDNAFVGVIVGESL